MKKLFAFFALTLITLNTFAQQKVSILGDSYSTFAGYVTPAKNLCYYRTNSKRQNDMHDVNKTWWMLYITHTGSQLDTNNSYSGATICNTGYACNDYSDRSFVARMDNIGTPDVLFIFGGTNDCWAGSPIGEYKYSNWTKTDMYKFRPAFAQLLYHLKQKHPKMRIINICNCDLDGNYVSSMVEICKHYNVENIILHDIDKQDKHPSVKGMAEISRQIENSMKKRDH